MSNLNLEQIAAAGLAVAFGPDDLLYVVQGGVDKAAYPSVVRGLSQPPANVYQGLFTIGTVYAVQNIVVSPVDGNSYMCISAYTPGVGAPDPSTDATHWSPVSSATSAQVPTNLQDATAAVLITAATGTVYYDLSVGAANINQALPAVASLPDGKEILLVKVDATAYQLVPVLNGADTFCGAFTGAGIGPSVKGQSLRLKTKKSLNTWIVL